MATGASLEAIVLAGGFGSRFGGGKLTAPWRGGVLIDGALATAFAAPVRTVTIVTGADAGVAPAVEAFAASAGQSARLRIVHAADHAEGMGATLRTGIVSLPPDAAGAYVFLGDMPSIPVAVLSSLADALAAGALAAAPVFEGQRGHPVLFAAALFPDLAALGGDEGARQILQRLGPAFAKVPAPDAGVLLDIDTRDQLDRGGG